MKFYDATITEVLAKETFDLTYDDGDVAAGVHICHMREKSLDLKGDSADAYDKAEKSALLRLGLRNNVRMPYVSGRDRAKIPH